MVMNIILKFIFACQGFQVHFIANISNEKDLVSAACKAVYNWSGLDVGF